MFKPSYSDLKFTVLNYNYVCINLNFIMFKANGQAFERRRGRETGRQWDPTASSYRHWE